MSVVVRAVIAIGTAAGLAACAVVAPDLPPLEHLECDIGGLVRRHDVDGLGVALVRDGAVVYLRTFGTRDAARRLPLTPDTTMYGASLTKAAFAMYVMQLVGDGELDLDASIATLLPQSLPAYPHYADLADDPRWRLLTLRILLDHTSGFANFRWLEPDRKLRFHRDPGARYGYSGEGIELAQFVIETHFGVDIGGEMQRRLFDPLGMTRTSMTWRDDFAADVADGYLADGSVRPHGRRWRPDAAGSMDTSLRDVAALMAATVHGDVLPAAAKAAMIRRQVVIDSPTQFPTLADERTDADAEVGLGYGLGWASSRRPSATSSSRRDTTTARRTTCSASMQRGPASS